MATENHSDHGILARWSITEAELTNLVDSNPSLRGMLFGYVAELKLEKYLFDHDEIEDLGKADDHDRTKKGDRSIIYKGKALVLESKSLQTNSIHKIVTGWEGKAQVDGSDRRTVIFDDGTTLATTLLAFGEFDLLAVNCFAFGSDTWRWQFCLNSDLPHSTWAKYTEGQRRKLIASLVSVKWPPEPPFSDNIFSILDLLVS